MIFRPYRLWLRAAGCGLGASGALDDGRRVATVRARNPQPEPLL